MLVWEITLFRKTIIDAKILVLIILFFGSFAYIIDRRKYSSTYQMNWINIFAWLQSTLSWGFIICTLFMASNTFFGNNESITKDYQIDNISDMPGSKSRRSKRQPLVRINYNGKIKELVFSNNHLSGIDNYKLVTLKTKEGLFGFDIIEEQTLKENELGTMREKNQEIEQILKRLKEDMIDFIETGQTEYTEKDVHDCINIMTEYLNNIERTNSKEEGMKIVKKAVVQLNMLNEKCEHELIETGQREDIAEIIIIAGSLKGYNTREEDITEEWRDW